MVFQPEPPFPVLPDPADFPFFLSSFSALDRFYGQPGGRFLSLCTSAGLAETAKNFEELSFPGLAGADAVAGLGDETLLISCDRAESFPGVPEPPGSLPQLRFLYSPAARRFFDPLGVYPLLRGDRLLDPEDPVFNADRGWEPWLDAAVLVSRYGFKVKDSPRELEPALRGAPVTPFRQREVLIRILEGTRPDRGLDLLRRSGFLASHWPELTGMVSVGHGKEHHPEGDVWDHTLATFGYRKTRDLSVSLALLLHDTGKPLAEENQGHRFHAHAQIGGKVAARFLRRLGFSEPEVEIVSFLVGQHMLPGLSRTLPSYRVREVLSSPWYPLLLEVYRCDLCSTYRGPEGYYQACKVYRQFLRNEKNPFRNSEGKKLLNKYVE